MQAITAFTRFLKGEPEKVQIQLDQLDEKDKALDDGEGVVPQLYEEIRESVLENVPAIPASAVVPQYEYVMPTEKVSKSYEITQCSAYGVVNT
jgi:hypothetical protein